MLITIIVAPSALPQCCLIRDDDDREDNEDNYHRSTLCITNGAERHNDQRDADQGDEDDHEDDDKADDGDNNDRRSILRIINAAS